MDHRWPGRPQLQPDESFASWLARTAAANGLRPGELYRIVQPGEDRNPCDLDRYADDHLLDRLAESTGAEKRRLKLATFRRWTGKLFDNDYSAQKLAWLPPAGRVGGKRCHGQQFCPECLASDATPYLRLTWRLSFITVCPIHQRLLLDRYPHCGEPFNILRIIPRAREGALLAPKAWNILVPMAYWLMTDWPHQSIAAANAVARGQAWRPGSYPEGSKGRRGTEPRGSGEWQTNA